MSGRDDPQLPIPVNGSRGGVTAGDLPVLALRDRVLGREPRAALDVDQLGEAYRLRIRGKEYSPAQLVDMVADAVKWRAFCAQSGIERVRDDLRERFDGESA